MNFITGSLCFEVSTFLFSVVHSPCVCRNPISQLTLEALSDDRPWFPTWERGSFLNLLLCRQHCFNQHLGFRWSQLHWILHSAVYSLQFIGIPNRSPNVTKSTIFIILTFSNSREPLRVVQEIRISTLYTQKGACFDFSFSISIKEIKLPLKPGNRIFPKMNGNSYFCF